MKLPETFIYNPQGSNIYRMFNTKSKELIGEMIAYPNINRQLEIAELNIFRQKRQGYGTQFLNFAKKLSQTLGYQGNMSVIAGTTPFDPLNPAHIFYRKYGFTSDNKKIIKKIDKSIKKGKQLNHYTTPAIKMYYPDTTCHKLSFYKKIKNFLDKKFYVNL